MPTPTDILNLPSGAQWLKADLHVHTPASSDMAEAWANATPEDVVRIALGKGLDVIGITDHNTASWCDKVRKAAEGSSLTVFPGVEISTPQGHLLALFDTTTTSLRIEDLLVTVGIPRDKFGSLHVATPEGIAEIAASIGQAGGVAVAAHADAEHGFLKMIPVGAERQRVYVAQDLWAIEILDAASRHKHQNGELHGRRMTCIQSSDCWPKGADRHQLDGMAHRYSLLKIEERSISGIKLALLDPDIRVRLADHEPPSVDCSILGMWVTRGFLDGQIIRFNESVNCFIGDTGSGKSVATELLRFGLDQQPSVPKILGEVTSLLGQQLGTLGTVHILLAKGDSRYLVERTWGTPPDRPLVQRLTGTELQPIDNIDMRLFFPIKGFSQSEIIEFAREPKVRLSLTDDLIDCSTELSSIRDLKVSLRKNAAEVSAELAKEANIRQQLAERSGLVESVKEIDKVLADPKVTRQQFWYSEQNLLKDAKEKIDQLNDKVANLGLPLDISLSWPDDLDTLPNQDIWEKIKKADKDWQDHVTHMRTGATAKLSSLVETVSKLGEEWNERFEKAEAEYRQLLDQLDKDGTGLQALSERRKGLQERISSLDNLNQSLKTEIEPRVLQLRTARETLLNELQENRKAITKKREQKAKGLSSKLSNKIRLRVHARTHTADFRNGLQEIAQGSRLHGTDLDSVASNCHPVPFVKQLLAEDFDCLATQCGIERSKVSQIWDTIVDRNRMTTLYDLQLTDVEDVIEVQLEVSQGNYRPLEELSHGQKCMVVLMVALAEGDFPLLVDQPEDALHAPSIEEGIVSTLRSDRGSRQCIFATRNANILVSADVEQIIALQADANSGHVVGTGSLDQFDQRQLVIYHVEGGEEAFRRRRMMYTLEPSS